MFDNDFDQFCCSCKRGKVQGSRGIERKPNFQVNSVASARDKSPVAAKHEVKP